MSKTVFIAEKPSVADSFAKALKLEPAHNGRAQGYYEFQNTIITWCYGHLVTMSYPDVYDENLKRWSLDTLPFLPDTFLYEVIESGKKQFEVVAGLLNREDVTTIYVCTDSGREGEYIYRLVDQMAHVPNKEKRRVWIDSQTDEEIIRGIKEAKPLTEYDNLSEAAYLRAKEDYLMGINFSRLLTLKYGYTISNFLGEKRRNVVAVGRVMTCVLGMIVRREREIRNFIKTPFYRIVTKMEEIDSEGEWRAVEGSHYFASPALYKENGFKEKADAHGCIDYIGGEFPMEVTVDQITRKKERKKPPLLFNLAELQNACSKRFKISPAETLKVVQELYEKKLVTYPRTDARVLSTAVAKEITKNINGLRQFSPVKEAAEWVLAEKRYENLAKTQYVDDKQITDHYAIVPTGTGFGAIKSLSERSYRIYEMICRRFLSIFYPPAEYQKVSLVTQKDTERFFSNFKVLVEPGYLQIAGLPKKQTNATAQAEDSDTEGEEDQDADASVLERLAALKKGSVLTVTDMYIKEGETSPPKRYSSGSMILAMENAGNLIEDEELRAQIKGAGIGTSATRAGILEKLEKSNHYIASNNKTQILTPTQLGEMVYDVVELSIRSLLNPELTASWEKGLGYVEDGSITTEEYMVKLEDYIKKYTNFVINQQNQGTLTRMFQGETQYYVKQKKKSGGKKTAQKTES